MARPDEPDRAAAPDEAVAPLAEAPPADAPPPAATPPPRLLETAISTALLVPGVLLTVAGRVVVTAALTCAYVVASGPETSIFVLERPWLLGLLAIVLVALVAAMLATRRPRPRQVTASTAVTVLCAALVVAFGPVLLRPVFDVYGTLIRADAEHLGPLGRPGWLLLAGAVALALGAGVRHLAAIRVVGAAPDEADVRCYERAVAAGLIAVPTCRLLYPMVQRFAAEVGVSLPAITEGMLVVLDIADTYLLGWIPLGRAVSDLPGLALMLLLAVLPAVPLALARRSRTWRIVATTWMVIVTALACGLVLGVGLAFAKFALSL